jgi:protein SCO1/2
MFQSKTLVAIFGLILSSVGFCKDPIFEQQGLFKDEANQEVSLSSFFGKKAIVTMSYSSCKKTCPMMTMATLKKIEKGLTDKNKTAEIVILTFDPEQDTPEVLAAFKKKQGITSPHWHFLTGRPEDLRAVSKVLGLQNYYTMDDHILHDFKISVYSEAGDKIQVLDWDHREVANVFP